MKEKIIKLLLKSFSPKLAKATVAGIMIKDNKLLLCKRKSSFGKNKWGLPGGVVEFGEEAQNAIKREIKEETNLDTLKAEFLGYEDEYMPEISNHSVILVFKIKFSGKEKIDNIETSELRWFSKKEIGNLDFAFLKHKEIINKYFIKLK